ncbi:RNA polymerase sigma factor [Microbacterium phage GardenState]|uniref:RNA polymerase sigma factor n=2 Tax=Gardenstatevirus TaxID=3425012 RepID=A0A4Y6EI04_9CAUD|nr:RNA polymerase sigma factor [Microbacterium phage IAmGroot]QOI66962.1 RNA polymerase sigma factor [Microbacterium phage GardenState]
MTVTTTIAAIFTGQLSATVTRLELDEELALIEAAQNGNEAAYEALLVQYAHALKGLARTEYNRAGGTVDHDETRANVLLAFAEAVAECDGTTRVSAKLKKAALHVADEYHLVGGFSIPERTRQRYFQALREAGPDGDAVAKAAELGMGADTFAAVAQALRAQSLDELTGATPEHGKATQGGQSAIASRGVAMESLTVERGYSTTEQRVLVDQAFAAVDDITEGVIRDAYGFTEYDPIPDAEIAHRRGFSRSKVQRIRTNGIATMRVALGVDTEESEA